MQKHLCFKILLLTNVFICDYSDLLFSLARYLSYKIEISRKAALQQDCS